MYISYTSMSTKSGVSEICLRDDTFWDTGIDSYNGEIVCSILNKNYFRLIPFSKELYLENKEFHQYYRKAFDDSGIQLGDYSSNKSKEEVNYPLNWVKTNIDSINMDEYITFVNSVLLNKDSGLNTKQKFLAYSSVYKNHKIGIFNSTNKLYFDTWKYYEDEDYHHVNIYSITKDENKEKGVELAKKYILENNVNPIGDFSYTFKTFEDWFNFLLYLMIKENDTIRICPNCGKYFYPLNRSDTIYCDEISPQDENKTCKEYGAMVAYQNHLKTNEAMGLYRKIYMQKQMLAKRNPDLEEYQKDFEKYKIESKQWKYDVRNNKKTEEEYLTWLRSVKEKKV